MRFDIASLMIVAVANLLALSAVLPLVMGSRPTTSARHAQTSLLLITLGWGALTASTRWFDFPLSVLSMASMSGGLLMLHRALAGWLGPRPGTRLMQAIAVLMPLGYALGFDHYAFRVGWANFLLATMLLVLARATLVAHRTAGRRWRMVFLGAFTCMAALTAARGVLGAFTNVYPTFSTPTPVNVAALLTINISLVVCMVAILAAWRDETEGRLRTLADTDGLTGILNRRGFHERAQALFANALRYRQPLTVAMLDLDRFKLVNDTHGHAKGDQALTLFARLLGETRRTGDLVGRLGGEEFCVLLPGSSKQMAAGFDLRLRARLQESSAAQLGFALNYSAGVAALKDTDATLEGLLARADTALYQSKKEGRARLVVAEGGSGNTII